MNNRQVDSFISGIKHRTVWSWCLIGLAIGAIFYGLNCYTLLIDEAYMALCCKDVENSPLAMMTFFIGNKWISLWGDSLVTLRMLCRVGIMVSIAIGGLYLWKQTGNLLLVASICLLSALTGNLADHAIYNWDTGAYPVEALGALALLLYVSRPDWKYAVFMGVSWGLMTAFRLPLIAFGAAILIAVWGVNRGINGKALGHLTMALTGMIAAWLACVLVMTGSVATYIDSFRLENIITGHSVNVLEPYINQFVWYFPQQVFFGMPALIAMLVAMIYSFKGLLSLRSLLIIEFVLMVVAFGFTVSYLRYSTMLLSGIGIPILLILLAWPVIAKYTGIDSTDSGDFTFTVKLQLWLLLIVMLLMGFGSDTAFQRWSILFLLPMGVGVIWPTAGEQSKRVIKYVVAIFVPFLLFLIPIKYKMVSSEAERFVGDPSSVLYGTLIPLAEQERYVEIKETVDSLQAHGLNYTFAGLKSRYIYSGEYEKGHSILAPLHYYHWVDGNRPMIDRFAEKADAVIYLGEYTKDFEYLKRKYGFEIVAKKTHCTVLSKNKK